MPVRWYAWPNGGQNMNVTYFMGKIIDSKTIEAASVQLKSKTGLDSVSKKKRMWW